MIYLSKAKRYFDENTVSKFSVLIIEHLLMAFIVHRLKSRLLVQSDIESYFDTITAAQETVDRCSNIVRIQGKPSNRASASCILLLIDSEYIDQSLDLKKLLEYIDRLIQ